MARRYSRTELRAAGAGLLVVVLLLLSLGDGRTTGKPSGPPNTLVVAWSYVTTGRALDARDVPPALSDEALAVPVGHSVRIIDTRSGQLLSIVNGFAEESPDLGLSGGVLFLVDTQDHFKDTLRAYDPATGRELWQRKAAPGPDGKGAGDFAVGGVLLTGWGPVVMDGDRALALDPRTGAVRWNVRLDAHCTTPRPYLDTPYRMAATSTHLLLLRHCTGDTAELQAVDERDGRSVWRKRLGRGGNISVSAADGALGIRMDDEFRLLTEAGEEILRQAGSGSPLGAKRGVVYAGVDQKLLAVRADTRKPAWKRARPQIGFAFIKDELIVDDASADGSYSGDARWSVGDAAGQGPGASTFVNLDVTGPPRCRGRSPERCWGRAGNCSWSAAKTQREPATPDCDRSIAPRMRRGPSHSGERNHGTGPTPVAWWTPDCSRNSPRTTTRCRRSGAARCTE
ncbi:PQQ-like beta-propeller repeat protein [Streptomyces griseus]|uniref:outer membrane protein assembly factor BamB family protein n=1 Tax=Streptomyces griseus TaxID=1911 RepID=UPI003869D0A8|nr:PQQ-like beta-propeller repeat protein [Streptomyces fimicarius]WTC91442.1 PQQ-like beta-propeller repeat protein [Streptomyces griseus]WTD65925.1 PQQ-like beta-propeller repeat protein [Streptomyces griseus]